ncbi:response regulator [uncultured Desulfobulbus sp.]|uniref:response regulator n=1 Tax=uncultured Desulfobulbus sp. TaxID=239745 RepID=UPI0029C673BC|nr:response regulator [uncultured Desulfobulbus sp.]
MISSPLSTSAVPPRPTSVLVVEDNPAALHLVASILEKEQYAVTRAVNGLEAMQILEEQPAGFDVILLDRMMPVMDGMEVTRKMQADSRLRFIPIIMLTAADKPEEISEGIKAGVFYYLTKPIERKTLLSIISSAVKEVKHRKALQTEMRRHRMSFGLIQVLKGSYRTLDEAESMSSFLANCFPDPERALTGVSELLINAVEHGNLGINYDDKTELMDRNDWRQEVERRLQAPEYRDRQVTVIFERKNDSYYLQITDQGEGFNWKGYLKFDPSRATHNHGRGIAMANMIAFDRLLYNEQGNQVTAIMEKSDADSTTDDYWS